MRQIVHKYRKTRGAPNLASVSIHTELMKGTLKFFEMTDDSKICKNWVRAFEKQTMDHKANVNNESREDNETEDRGW